MAQNTTRLGLTFPEPEDSNDVPRDIKRLAQQLDLAAVSFLRGVAADRPSSTGPTGVPNQPNYNPGTQGRWYYATNTGQLSYDYGGGWQTIGDPGAYFNAKGDLLVGTGAGQMTRLGVGADGYSLISRSSAADGVDWEPVVGQAMNLPGATTPTRFVGGTHNGYPTSGTFQVGDFVVDNNSDIWVCTYAGSPGYWVRNGGDIPAFYSNISANHTMASGTWWYINNFNTTGIIDTAGTMTTSGYVIPRAGMWCFSYGYEADYVNATPGIAFSGVDASLDINGGTGLPTGRYRSAAFGNAAGTGMSPLVGKNSPPLLGNNVYGENDSAAPLIHDTVTSIWSQPLAVGDVISMNIYQVNTSNEGMLVLADTYMSGFWVRD